MTVRVRSLAALVALVAALVAAGTPAAAPQSNLVIRPGHGIGKFRLGMTQAEVRRTAGRPNYVVDRGRTFGLRRVEYQYGYAADYTVLLVGRPGRMRVTRVSTLARRERTPKGVGPFSTEVALLRAHPAARCTRLRTGTIGGVPYLATLTRTCTLVTASGRQTIFRTGWAAPDPPPGRPRIKPSVENYSRYARISEVVVTGGA
ncbi:MAG: hypothetical protein M3321_05545 [Actinomycetota bacterium]|nr:hypothetical protein [Actinomycetota bacterium]